MPSPNATQITPPRVSIIDPQTGYVSREWYRWFYSLYNVVGAGTGIIPISGGGTGISTIPTDGQLLIGNGTGYSLNTLTAGTAIGVINTAGNITVNNTGVTSVIAGAGVTVDQPTGDVTVDNTGVLSIIAGAGITVDQATGDVTVDNAGVLTVSGGTTGLTPSTATAGDVVLSGTLVTTNGGTGAAGSLTGYVYGNGASAMSAVATIPNTDITGLGTISTQNTGATGSFTTVDFKTVTVTNGIITSIV
jgi:trimeric autotransporter adhesin